MISPLAGIPITVKDLFDIDGERTLAGSRVLIDTMPARRDAVAVETLKSAGAVLVGRTNMSEFAFSAIGHNPHFGTPGNPWDRSRVPGGSSSGAAVSVADGMAYAALGSDTGGSVRIPAAFCGLAGFKPTKSRISVQGTVPLCPTFDSIGVIARSINDCAILDSILTGQPLDLDQPIPPKGLRLALIRSVVLEQMDSPTAAAFERAIADLSRAGARIVGKDFSLLHEVVDANQDGGFPPVEAFAWHERLLDSRGAEYDNHARLRFELGRSVRAAEYIRLRQRRDDLMVRAAAESAPYDALLMPTCAVTPPRIADIETDEECFWKYNALIPRNTALVNFLDQCAATLPIHRPGEVPVGLMLVGRHLGDRRLLRICRGIESEIGQVA